MAYFDAKVLQLLSQKDSLNQKTAEMLIESLGKTLDHYKQKPFNSSKVDD